MRVAERLIQKHHTRDPFRIAEALGYIVIRAPLCGVRGFYQYLKRNHIIYLDTDLPEWEARFVCAHELGHSLLHRGTNRIFMDSRTFQVSSKAENEANLFASYLLVSNEELKELAQCGYTTEQLARQFWIPEPYIRIRFPGRRE